MKTTYSIAALIGIMVLLPGCWEKPCEEKKAGLVVINVLDKDLYEDCHIKGSINVPFEMIEEYAQQLDKNSEIVLYCSNYQCATSEFAAQKLRQQGFAKVSVYEGGTAEWYQLGLPVDGPHTQTYLSKPCKQCSFEQADGSSSDKENAIEIISVHDLAQKMGLCVKCENAAA